MAIAASMRAAVVALFWLSLLAVTAGSLVPVALLPPQALDLWDKAQHALGFAWLGVCGLWAHPRHARAVVIGLCAWGGASELMQAATGWRHGDGLDWLADAIGVALALLLWRSLPARWSRRA